MAHLGMGKEDAMSRGKDRHDLLLADPVESPSVDCHKTHLTERSASDDGVGGRISFNEAGLGETEKAFGWLHRMAQWTEFRHGKLGQGRQRFIRAVGVITNAKSSGGT